MSPKATATLAIILVASLYWCLIRVLLAWRSEWLKRPRLPLLPLEGPDGGYAHKAKFRRSGIAR
jgi:hypothetical protein